MQGFTFAATLGAEKIKLTKSMYPEIYAKGTRSRCMLEGYDKDNYYMQGFILTGITDAEKTKLRLKN